MELEKQTQQYLHPALGRTLLQEETAETIVPDTSPDVERIVSVTGEPLLRGKELRDGSAQFSGGIRATVLYVPEGENLPRALDVYLPWVTRAEDPAITQDSRASCDSWLRGIDARLVNSRKILVRANLATAVEVWNPMEEEICADAAGVEGLQVKTASWPVTLPAAAEEKSFAITDAAQLPSGQPQVAQVYQYSAQPELTESRVVGTRAVFKGNVNLRILYRSSAGDLETWSFTVPFSQFAELPNAGEGDELVLIPVLTGADLEPDGDGGRLLYTINLTVQCLALQRRTVRVIEDLYSTRHTLAPERRALRMVSRLDRQTLHETVSQSVPADAAEVLDTRVYLDVPQLQREAETVTITAAATVSLLYRDAAGALQGVTGQVPVSVQTQLAPGCHCQAGARPGGAVQVTPAAEGLEVRFGVTFTLDCTAAQPLEVVCGAELLELEESAQQPSIVVRALEAEQSLWDLAKACRTTVRAIQEANALTTEDAPAGRLLLIPRAG